MGVVRLSPGPAFYPGALGVVREPLPCGGYLGE